MTAEVAIPDRCNEIIAMMLNHSGHGYTHIDPEMMDAFIRYEWDSDRWVMVVEPKTEKLLGWLSWYNFDDESIEHVKDNGLPGCFYLDIVLSQGDNLYLANTVVSSEVSSGVFRRLVSMAKLANPDAKTINAFLWNRVSPLWRWRSFSLTDSSPINRSIEHGRR